MIHTTITKTIRRRGALALALTFGLMAGADRASAQEGGAPPEPEPEPAPQEGEEEEIPSVNPLRPPGGSGGPEAELRELFLKVDKRLRRSTELLWEASSGDGSGADQIGSARIDELIREAEAARSRAQSGIAKLLEASGRQNQAASDEIERILQIAAENPSQSSSSSSSSSQQQQSSGEQPQQGQTPSGSRREEKGEQPGGEQQGQQQQGQQEQQQGQPQNGDRPDDNRASDDPPQDSTGGDPRESETGDAARPSGMEDWGDLPVHLRKVFQNRVSDDVPPRYRDWIDAYYGRLNRSSPR